MTSPQAYDPNVPLGSDTLAATQPDFLANFGQLYDAFAVNHVPLDAVASAGNHNIVELLQQTKAYQTGVGEITVYTKDAPGQTDQIFLRYQGNGQEIQYTNYQLYSLPVEPGLIQFFTFLPGRILVYFGVVTAPFSGTNTEFTLNLSPPIAKNIFSVNFCNKETALQPPRVEIPKPIGDFYKTLTLKSVFLGVLATKQILYYVVMANI